MPGFFDYFRQIVAPKPSQTVPPPQQQVRRATAPVTAAQPTPIQPSVARQQTGQSATIAARYGGRYAGYEDLITQRPGGGYDLRAADAAIAADLRKQEISSLSGYGLTRYQFQQAGEQKRQAAAQIQAAHGNVLLQQSLLLRYQAATEREWSLGIELERGWMRGEIPPTGPTPPKVSRGGVLQIRGEGGPGFQMPEMAPMTLIPKGEFKQPTISAGPGLFVTGFGQRAIEMTKLPETTTITEPAFLGIFGGGTKTIPTKEYLEKYETVGAGTLLSPGAGGVRLKGQYAGPVEQFGRWWSTRERVMSGGFESAGLPMFQRGFWEGTAERAATLHGPMRDFIIFGAGVGQQWTAHPIETVGSLALGGLITAYGPTLSATVRTARAGSILARIAPAAGTSLRIGGAALVGTWGIFTGVSVATSKTPVFRAGQAAGEITPWLLPGYAKALPAFGDWIRAGAASPDIPLWRAGSAQEIRKPRTPLKLETVPSLDVREFMDLRNIVPTESVSYQTTEFVRSVSMPEIMSSKPSMLSQDVMTALLRGRAIASSAAIKVTPVPEIVVSLTPISRLSYPFVLAAGVSAIKQTPLLSSALTSGVATRTLPITASIVGSAATTRTEILSRTAVIPRVASITTPKLASLTLTTPITITPLITVPKITTIQPPITPTTITPLPPIIPKFIKTFDPFGHGGGGRRRPLGAFGYRKWQSVLMPSMVPSFKVKGLDLAFGGKPRKGAKKPKRIRI
jgi:hypothetical protein